MRLTAGKDGKAIEMKEEDRWTDLTVKEDGREEKEMSTEIHFEISAERYDRDDDHDERPLPKAMGIIRGATMESVRWALGTIIGMFVAKRMNEDEKE